MISDDYVIEFQNKVNSKSSARQIAYAVIDKQMEKIWGYQIRCLEVLADDLFIFISRLFKDVREETTFEFAIASILGKALLRLEEIIVLLWKGYPDGAMALSRSLHELTVCFLFLGKHQNDLPLIEWYFSYCTIEKYRRLNSIKETCIKNDRDFDKEEELEQLSLEQTELIQKYGKSFKNDFGWAFCIEGVSNFSEMENDVEARKIHSYYSLSNSIIHSNPEGNRFSLGTLGSNKPIISTGPSLSGLEIPFDYSLISISAITKGLGNLRNDDKIYIQINALHEVIVWISNMLSKH